MSDEQTTVDEAVQVAAREQFVLSESFGVMTRDEQWVWRVAWMAGRDYQRQQAGAAVNGELVKALETIGAGDCGSAYAEMPDLDCLAMQQAARDGTLTPNWRREHQPYFESGDHFCNRCRARAALARARGEQ